MLSCAPTANPPNNAQLGAPSISLPSYIRVRAVLRECGGRQTDRQTDGRYHYTSRVVYDSRKMCQAINIPTNSCYRVLHGH